MLFVQLMIFFFTFVEESLTWFGIKSYMSKNWVVCKNIKNGFCTLYVSLFQSWKCIRSFCCSFLNLIFLYCTHVKIKFFIKLIIWVHAENVQDIKYFGKISFILFLRVICDRHAFWKSSVQFNIIQSKNKI